MKCSHPVLVASTNSPSDEPGKRHLYDRMLCLGMLAAVAITMALYLPNLGTEFVEWDLLPYRAILDTTNYGSTAWALFTDLSGAVVSGYYAPLGSISLMLDKALVGSSSASPQVTLFINMLFHCLNGLLLFALLKRAGGSGGLAILGAFIFLVHPIQVSSVAWFAQRKGLLATTFYLMAFLAYFVYLEKHRFSPYLCALFFFLLAVLTKPIAIVLPAALACTSFLIFPASRRIQEEQKLLSEPDGAHFGETIASNNTKTVHEAVTTVVRSFKPLAPFFFLAVGMALAVTVSERAGMDARVPDLSVMDRLIVSASAIWFYFSKVIVPIGFMPIYPRWEPDASSLIWWWPLAMLAGSLALIWKFRHNIGPFPLWCLANFIIPLLPVLGIVEFAYLRHSYVADHFMYLPMVGLAGLLAACGQTAWTKLGNSARYPVAIAAAAYLVLCAVQTITYSRIWESSVALWTYNLMQNPNDGIAHSFLGHALLKSGKPGEAADHFRKTVTLNEQYISEHETLKASGEREVTRRHVEKIKKARVTLGGAYHNLGNTFLFRNMHHDAIAAYNRAVELRPDLVDTWTNLGVAYAGIGNSREALRCLSRAVGINPQNYQAQYNLAVAYDMTGNREMAKIHFEKARVLQRK